MPSLPNIVVLSETLRLEKIAPHHAESLFQQIDTHRHYLAQFVDWTQFTRQPSDTMHFIQRCEREAAEGRSYTWAICVQQQAVGTISFNANIDWAHREALFGYWLSPEAQGNGIVTQAVNAIMAQTRAYFDHYILTCAVHNVRSNAVAKRCGFVFVQTLSEAEKIGGQYYDQHCYRKSFTPLSPPSP